MIADKVILVDCDGVLCDWLYAFDQWMERHDYEVVEPDLYKVSDRFNLTHREGNKLCRMFNESAWIRKLPPLRDAIKYVRKLHEEHGYVFRLISSLSNDEYSQHLRTKNLRELFGSTVFERYTYLDTVRCPSGSARCSTPPESRTEATRTSTTCADHTALPLRNRSHLKLNVNSSHSNLCTRHLHH